MGNESFWGQKLVTERLPLYLITTWRIPQKSNSSILVQKSWLHCPFTYPLPWHQRSLAVSELYRVYDSHGCVQNVQSLVTVILSVTEFHVMYAAPLPRVGVPYHRLVLQTMMVISILRGHNYSYYISQSHEPFDRYGKRWYRIWHLWTTLRENK